MTRCAARWRKRDLLQAWHSWLYLLDRHNAVRRVTRLVLVSVQRMCHRQLARAVARWSSIAHAAVQRDATVAAAQGFRATLVKGIVRGWQQRQAARGFRRWREAALQVQQQVQCVARTLGRLQNALVSAAWRSWQDAAVEAGRLQLCETHRQEIRQLRE